jgi:hypothetical protein
MESLFEEKLNHTTKILLSQAIFLKGYIAGSTGSRKLSWITCFQAIFLLAFEHILELLKDASPVEMGFLGPLLEIGDGFVNGELNTKFAAVEVDFHF